MNTYTTPWKELCLALPDDTKSRHQVTTFLEVLARQTGAHRVVFSHEATAGEPIILGESARPKGHEAGKIESALVISRRFSEGPQVLALEGPGLRCTRANVELLELAVDRLEQVWQRWALQEENESLTNWVKELECRLAAAQLEAEQWERRWRALEAAACQPAPSESSPEHVWTAPLAIHETRVA